MSEPTMTRSAAAKSAPPEPTAPEVEYVEAGEKRRQGDVDAVEAARQV